jgi:PAS domain S-box-containing protein
VLFRSAAWILRRVLTIDRRLRRLRDLIRLTTVIASASALVAMLSIGVFVAAGAIARGDYVTAALDFWIGDLIGITTFTPFLLVYGLPMLKALTRTLQRRPSLAPGQRPEPLPQTHPQTPSLHRQDIPGVAAALAALLAVLWLAFGSPAADQINLFYLCFLPALWIAIRYGFQGSALGTLSISTGIILATSAFNFQFSSPVEAQILLLAITLVSLFLGALITERDWAEQQQKRTEEAYRALVDYSLQGLCIIQEGRVVFANAALAGMFGYTVEELLVMPPQDVSASFTPDGRTFLDRQRRARQDGHPTSGHYEIQVYTKDGDLHWTEQFITSITYQGRPALQIAVIDITGRKQAETDREAALAALQESEERVRKAFDTELIGMAISRRRDGVYIDANPGFLKMTGYTADEVIGHTSLELNFFFPSQRERLVSKIEKDGRLHNQELTYPTKHGELRTMLFSISPITVNHEACLLATMVDITARKRAAERTQALLRATDRLSRALTQDDLLNTLCQEVGRALNLSAISVLRYRPKKGRFTLERAIGLPEVYKRTYRAPGQEAYTQFAHESIAIVPDVQAIDSRINHNLYVACDVRTLVEVSIVYKDELLGVLNVHTLGEPRDFASGELVLLRGIAGQAAQAIVAARLLAQLRTSEHQLQRLSERLVEVQEIERRALARELHDELGQILTVIKLNLQALSQKGLEDEAQAAVDASLRAADGAIEQVRRLSRDLRPSLLDNLGLVPALRSFVDQQAQHADFNATFSADPTIARLPEVLENAYFRIAQEAMTNIMRHAQATRVAVALRVEDDALVLTLRDDGIGFDIEDTLTDVDAGRSLGLVSMRERAHLIGGTFTVASEPGCGAEIRVRTPLTSKPVDVPR